MAAAAAVLDGKGNVIGAIVNVLINKRGVPKAAVVEFAGFLGVGNRDVAVEWDALRFAVNGIFSINRHHRDSRCHQTQGLA